MLTRSHCYPNPEPKMASKTITTRKPKPQPLTRSLDLIQEERKNVARRTRERCALLSIESETDQDYSVDKATQTEIAFALREVHVEIHNWHTCLNAFCFCLLLLCMNLLYFQWLYTATKLTRL